MPVNKFLNLYRQVKKIEKTQLQILVVMMVGLGLLIYLIIEEVTLRQELDSLPTDITNIKKYKNEKSRPSTFEEYIHYSTLIQTQINTQNTVRTTFFTALSGVLFTFTAYFSWRNLKVSEETLKLGQIKQGQEQETNKRKQISERFNKAVDLLTHEKTHAHLGGIYILGEIANIDGDDSYYNPVMEMLTAYLRERAPFPFKEAEASSQKPLPRTNIQAVLTILSTIRSKAKENSFDKGKEKKNVIVNLSKTDLREAMFSSQSCWKETEFSEANLSEADLAYVLLSAANFAEAVLDSANFAEAVLDSAIFTETDLSKAVFTGADLSKAVFTGADLNGAVFTGADLSKAVFTGANLNGAVFTRAKNLTHEQLNKAKSREGIILPEYLQSSNSNRQH